MENVKKSFIGSWLKSLLAISAMFVAFFAMSAVAFALPTVTTKEYVDFNGDGVVDRIKLTFDENITACDAAVADFVSTPGDVTGLAVAGGSVTGTCNGSDAIVYLVLGTPGNANITSHSTAPTLTYAQVTGNITSASGNLANFGPVNLTDGAGPVMLSATLGQSSNRNIITFVYSEAIDNAVTGASTIAQGDITGAGTIVGFGTATTTGDVTVPTTKNTVSGDGTTTLTVVLASQLGGYMDSTSTTKPSGVFTPATTLQDAAGNAVSALTTPTITDGTWDLTKPTVTSITVSEGTGLVNGKIDKAVLVFSKNMLDATFTDADGSLASGAGTFTTGTANDTTLTFNRTADTATTGTAATDGDFTYSGATSLITDLAGNLLDTATDGQIASGDVTETDGATPVLLTAVFNTASNQNNLTLTYSEALEIYTGGDGATGNIAADGDATSTASLGAMTTARTLAGLVTWNGTSNFASNVATANEVALDITGKIITVTFNNTSGSFFLTGSIAPTTPVVTVTADADDLEDAAGLAAVAPTAGITASTTAWDSTPPSTITYFRVASLTSGLTGVNLEWTAHSTLSDWSRYMFAYGTSAGVGLSSSLWASANDANLTSRTQQSTRITGLTQNNTYYAKAYAIDIAGNVSTGSSETNFTLSSYAGDTTPVSTSFSGIPTDFTVSTNDNLQTVLTWKDPMDDGFNKVEIYRAKGADSTDYTLLASVGKWLQTYTDTNVYEGEVVKYKVKALNEDGYAGSFTATQTITIGEGETSEEVVEDETTPDTTTPEGETTPDTTTPTPQTERVVFADSEGHWAETHIEAMADAGVMKGRSEGVFDPDGGLNRSEAATMLFRVLGLGEPVAPSSVTFADVKTTDWFAGYIVGLKELGLVNGLTSTTFAPLNKITRAEFLHMAMNVYYYLTETTLEATEATTAFEDIDRDSWYALTLTEAYEMEFILGKTATKFAPNETITRGEAAKILFNMFHSMLAQ